MLTKSKIVVTIILLIVSTPVFSQFKIGFKAGYINSWVNNKDFYSNNSFQKRNGFLVGAVCNYSLNKSFSAQAEVLYSQKGYTYSAGDIIFNYFSNYIEAPISLKAKLSGNIRPYIIAGIAPAFSISDTYSKYKSFDLAGLGGIGFEFGKEVMPFIEFRASGGLLKVHNPYYSNSKFANGNFSISGGILF